MEDDYEHPSKDDRAKAKRGDHSYNIRTGLEVNEKRKSRFIQSVQSTSPQKKPHTTESEFYESLSKKQKRQYDKLSQDIHRIELKGLKKEKEPDKIIKDKAKESKEY